jgi:hypothetical protein
MTHTTPNSTKHRPYRRPYWIGMVVIALTLLLLSSGLSVTAAPPNQTVPQPTATPEPPPQPTATSTPRPDDDGDDDDDEDNNDRNENGSSAAPPPAEAEEAEEAAIETLQAAVDASALNVRSGPGTEFAVIDLLENGATVTVVGQNEAGDWWLICCVGGEEAEGWVAARFMTPAFDPTAAALPLADVPALANEPTLEANSLPDAEASLLALELSAPQASQPALQGATIEVQLVVSNPGDESARNVQLRNEVPSYLTVEEASAGSGNVTQSLTDEGATVLDVRWPELSAGAQVSTTILLRVDRDVLDGTIIDNLIAANADNAAATSTGVVIGLPPATLPDFQ